MSTKAIFIDIDNTLLDFDEYVRQALRTGFATYGLGEYDPGVYDVFEEINNSLWRRIEDKTLTFEELKQIRFRMVFERLGIDCDGPTFETSFREALNESAIPVDGAYEMLDALYGKYRLYAASNGPYEQQMHRLELAGMTRYFDNIFISERVGAAKPSAAFYDYAFRQINGGVPGASGPSNAGEPLLPQDCIAIGDSLTSDIAGGLGYGMRACWYRHGSTRQIDEREVFRGRGFAVATLAEFCERLEHPERPERINI